MSCGPRKIQTRLALLWRVTRSWADGHMNQREMGGWEKDQRRDTGTFLEEGAA